VHGEQGEVTETLGDVKAIMIDSLVVIVSCALTHPKELVKKWIKNIFKEAKAGW